MRYLPLDASEREAMLSRIGVPDIEALFADIPADKRVQGLLDMPRAKSEMAVERAMSAIANRSLAAGSVPFFLGSGAYLRHIPATVDHLIQRSEFLTSYTPYQPEIAQGTLQVLFEFQTQVAALTGMEAANASMYDGSTACGEAMLMAHRLTRRNRSVISGGLHPQYAEVCATLARMAGGRIGRLAPDLTASEDIAAAIDDETSCVIVQSPDFFGNPRDLTPIAALAHARGALLIAVFTDPVALAAVRSPGEMDADIAVGEGQGIGNALNFGGPYVGLFATRAKNVRQMPGRLAGETVDAEGRRSFVLTLSNSRAAHSPREGDEQHLHQLGLVCAGVLDPSDSARRCRTPTLSEGQSRQCGAARRAALVGSIGRNRQYAFLQRVRHANAAIRGGADRGFGKARRDRRIAGLTAFTRGRARRLHHRRQHGDEFG